MSLAWLSVRLMIDNAYKNIQNREIRKKNRKLNLAKLNPCMLHTLCILKALQSFILPRAHTKKCFWVKKQTNFAFLFKI